MFNSLMGIKLAATLCVACGLTACQGRGQAPVNSDASEAGVLESSVPTENINQGHRIAQPIEIIARLAADDMEGRKVGTRGNARAAAWLRNQMALREIQPFAAQNYDQSFEFKTRDDKSLTGLNLLGVIAGSSVSAQSGEGPIIVVTAHYDHLGKARNGKIFNGADDNASGVAGALAIADDLLADPPQNTVLIALLDAEEVGLQGAKALLRHPQLASRQIALNINLDMLSKNSKNELYIAGAYHTPEIKEILSPVIARAPVTLIHGHDDPALGNNDWTLQSDHGPFHRNGIPFVYFGVEDHPDYHKTSDEFSSVPVDFFNRSIASVVLATRALDQSLDRLIVP